MGLVAKAYTDIIEFSRASEGYAPDAAGDLQQFATDAPRYDWSLGATKRRQLFEGAKTRLNTYPIGPVANWSVVGSGVVMSDRTDDDQGVFPGMLLESAGSAADRGGPAAKVTFVAATQYAIKARYKEPASNSSGRCRIALYGTGGFMQLAVIGPVGALAAATEIGVTVDAIHERVDGDYYETEVVFTIGATGYDSNVSIGPDTATSGDAVVVSAIMCAVVNGDEDTIGSWILASPGSANVARAADLASKSLAGYDFSAGITALLKGRMVASVGSLDRFAQLSDGTNSNDIQFIYRASSAAMAVYVHMGGTSYGPYVLTPALDEDFAVGISLSASGDLLIAVDGATEFDVSGLGYPALDELTIADSPDGGSGPAIALNEMTLIKEGPSTQAALEALTA